MLSWRRRLRIPNFAEEGVRDMVRTRAQAGCSFAATLLLPTPPLNDLLRLRRSAGSRNTCSSRALMSRERRPLNRNARRHVGEEDMEHVQYVAPSLETARRDDADTGHRRYEDFTTIGSFSLTSISFPTQRRRLDPGFYHRAQ